MDRVQHLPRILAAFACAAALGAAEIRCDDGQGDRAFVVAADESAAVVDGRAVLKAAAPAPGDAPVLYEVGGPRDAAHRRVVAHEIIVAGDAAAATAVADEFATEPPRATHVAGRWRLRVADPQRALAVATALRARGVVADPALRRLRTLRYTPADPLFAQQWHLGPTSAFGLNAQTAWDITLGAGATVALIDDGLEVAHPDLSPNCPPLASGLHHDFIGVDGDPTESSGDTHGTSCGGLIAARDADGIGGCGVAPRATLLGLRLIAGLGGSDLDEADALAWHDDIVAVSSNSWGPADDGVTLDGPGTQAAAALDAATANGRGGKGVVFCWAAGNGDVDGDNAEYDGYAASPDVIAVGAATTAGVKAPYSETGANLTVCAPSSDSSGVASHYIGTTTVGGYTHVFGGTSAAAPQIAGVCALMIAANPQLGWRDVREILMTTAAQIDAGDPGWFTNAAGQRFHPGYGAGLADAHAAVVMAQGWTALPPRQTWSVAKGSLALAIPDDSTTGAATTFAVARSSGTQGQRVEQALVHVVVAHGRRSDLEYFLTSPAGTRVQLAPRRPNDTTANLDWTFHDVQHWGEGGVGGWILSVRDRVSGVAGRLSGATLTLTGTYTTAPSAGDDSATTPEDTAVDIDVGANDASAYGDVPTIAAIAAPAHGAATAIGAGTIRYVPAADYDGVDAFAYTIVDRFGGAATATVSVTMTPVPDPPAIAITAPATGTLLPAGTTSIPVAVTASDPDPGDTISVVVADGAFSTATLPYVVPITRAGTHRILASAIDSTARTTTAEVIVRVAGAHPTIASTPARLVASPLSAWTYTPTVSGAAGAVAWTLVEHPVSFAGAIGADGSLSWTPAAGDVGTDARFRILVDDGVGVDEQAILLRVDNDDLGLRRERP